MFAKLQLLPRIKDNILVILFSFFIYALFVYFDLYELGFYYSREYEHLELDELVGLVVAFLLSQLVVNQRLLKQSKIDRQKIYELSQDIERQALSDYLTDLPNRRAFEEQTRELIEQASSQYIQFTLLYIDLDSFKYINDTLGHKVGDRLLIEVSERLLAASPEQSTLYRVGGDEFCLVLTGNKSNACCLQLCEALNSTIGRPYVIEANKLQLSQSIGISRYPEDGDTFEKLLSIADIAMYMGKSKGRVRSNFKDRNFIDDMQRRFVIQNDLTEALSSEQFYIEYQPKVTLSNGKLIGSEALIRWVHPEHGFIPPDEFIYIAEETHVIRHIDFYVLEKVCQQIKTWGDNALPVAVNLSPLLFADENLAQDIINMLDKYQVAPRLIELEITERTLIANSSIPLQTCNTLASEGIALSLDDFGTGYSSLSHIADFPISTLKIDRSFISQICASNKTKEIISAIIQLADACNIEVLAEGVETYEQSKIMTELGCQSAQGYYYDRPLPLLAFTESLNEGKFINSKYIKFAS